MKPYFKFGDYTYTLDMEKFMEFVMDIAQDEFYKNTTLTQTYAVEPGDDDISLISKEIMENRLNGNDTSANLRYDFAKTLLESALKENDGLSAFDEGQMSFGQKLAINSLIDAGIIRQEKE